jgi:hypothetical protein
MSTDSIPLRRSVFGYRPHDVRQFLLEREEVMSEVSDGCRMPTRSK